MGSSAHVGCNLCGQKLLFLSPWRIYFYFLYIFFLKTIVSSLMWISWKHGDSAFSCCLASVDSRLGKSALCRCSMYTLRNNTHVPVLYCNNSSSGFKLQSSGYIYSLIYHPCPCCITYQSNRSDEILPTIHLHTSGSSRRDCTPTPSCNMTQRFWQCLDNLWLYFLVSQHVARGLTEVHEECARGSSAKLISGWLGIRVHRGP